MEEKGGENWVVRNPITFVMMAIIIIPIIGISETASLRDAAASLHPANILKVRLELAT